MMRLVSPEDSPMRGRSSMERTSFRVAAQTAASFHAARSQKQSCVMKSTMWCAPAARAERPSLWRQPWRRRWGATCRPA
eukprot:12059362-Heterocapsa_arctica.AAC.1